MSGSSSTTRMRAPAAGESAGGARRPVPSRVRGTVKANADPWPGALSTAIVPPCISTRSLVEMHGGTIAVESAPGQGSAFAFTVPLTREGTGLLAPPADSPAAGARILVVEDEPDIAGLIRRYLERAGHEVAVARDGTEALKLARETRPDLI